MVGVTVHVVVGSVAHEQLPLAQVCSSGHVVPQAPQLTLSVSRLTQVPPHRVSPVGQPHTLPVHTSPPVQAVPQAPQSLASFVRLTHIAGEVVLSMVPLHPVSPVGHVQVPLTHVAPSLAHTFPHTPQLLESVWTLWQVDPQ
jgi:hypothetical protein